MCLAFFWLRAHPQLLLLLAFNRDEYLERATADLHVWEDDPTIIGGRDLVNGGTWLGISRTGRFAFVTNFREANFNKVDHALSRGALPTAFLQSRQTPDEFAAGLDLEKYNGLNLVVGDINSGTAVQASNRGGTHIERLPPGVHGVSNGELHSDWPKVQRGKEMLQDLLHDAELAEERLPWGDIFDALSDTRRPPNAQVPRSDVDWDLDLQCSSVFVPLLVRDGRQYGTRSQIVAAVWASGKIAVRERSLSNSTQLEWRSTAVISSLFSPAEAIDAGAGCDARKHECAFML